MKTKYIIKLLVYPHITATIFFIISIKLSNYIYEKENWIMISIIMILGTIVTYYIIKKLMIEEKNNQRNKDLNEYIEKSLKNYKAKNG